MRFCDQKLYAFQKCGIGVLYTVNILQKSKEQLRSGQDRIRAASLTAIDPCEQYRERFTSEVTVYKFALPQTPRLSQCLRCGVERIARYGSMVCDGPLDRDILAST